MERNLRKERVGIVVSDKMDKTVVVLVSDKRKHPLYKKKRREMEISLLGRLKDGLLDGLIGSGFNMGTLTSHALIENGRPMLVKYLSEKGPIKDAMIVEKEFETDEGKLWFLRNHGWRMQNPDVVQYSRTYRRPTNP